MTKGNANSEENLSQVTKANANSEEIMLIIGTSGVMTMALDLSDLPPQTHKPSTNPASNIRQIPTEGDSTTLFKTDKITKNKESLKIMSQPRGT